MPKSHITATLVTIDQQMIIYVNNVLKLYEIMALHSYIKHESLTLINGMKK